MNALVLIGPGLLIASIVLASGCERTTPQKTSLVEVGASDDFVILGDEIVDLGIIEPSKTPLAINFTIANQSTAQALIERVETSCTCARASASPKEIAPGMSGNIEVVIYRDAMGPQKATATLFSNLGILTVKVLFNVRSNIFAEPSRFESLTMRLESTKVAVVKLIVGDANVRPSLRARSRVDSNVAGLIHQASLVDDECRINFTTSNDLIKPGRYFGEVEIHRDEVADPILRVGWSVKVSAPIEVTPSVVVLTEFQEARSAQLTIVTLDPSSIDDIELSSRPQDATIKIEKTQLDDRTFVLDVLIPKHAVTVEEFSLSVRNEPFVCKVPVE